MNKWILCLPAELSLNEHIKWEEWKKEHKVDSLEIGLVCGNEIIDRLSNQGLCDKYFQSTFLNIYPKDLMVQKTVCFEMMK